MLGKWLEVVGLQSGAFPGCSCGTINLNQSLQQTAPTIPFTNHFFKANLYFATLALPCFCCTPIKWLAMSFPKLSRLNISPFNSTKQFCCCVVFFFSAFPLKEAPMKLPIYMVRWKKSSNGSLTCVQMGITEK